MHCLLFFRRTSTKISSSLCTVRVALVPVKSTEAIVSIIRAAVFEIITNKQWALSGGTAFVPTCSTQSASFCSYSSRNDFSRIPPKGEFGLRFLGTPIFVICAPKDMVNLSPNDCSFASVYRQSTRRYTFHVAHELASKVTYTRKMYIFVMTSHSAPTQEELDWSVRNHSYDHFYYGKTH